VSRRKVTRWVAVGVGVGLWVALWYGVGALLYFFLTLK
jgi:hypothetical protein